MHLSAVDASTSPWSPEVYVPRLPARGREGCKGEWCDPTFISRWNSCKVEGCDTPCRERNILGFLVCIARMQLSQTTEDQQMENRKQLCFCLFVLFLFFTAEFFKENKKAGWLNGTADKNSYPNKHVTCRDVHSCSTLHLGLALWAR